MKYVATEKGKIHTYDPTDGGYGCRAASKAHTHEITNDEVAKANESQLCKRCFRQGMGEVK